LLIVGRLRKSTPVWEWNAMPNIGAVNRRNCGDGYAAPLKIAST
jgi:hypothetical protein